MSVLWHKVYLIINILLFLVPLARFKSEYEEQVGTELNYSERTFKRIRKNALKKMESFLSEGEFKEYINES